VLRPVGRSEEHPRGPRPQRAPEFALSESRKILHDTNSAAFVAPRTKPLMSAPEGTNTAGNAPQCGGLAGPSSAPLRPGSEDPCPREMESSISREHAIWLLSASVPLRSEEHSFPKESDNLLLAQSKDSADLQNPSPLSPERPRHAGLRRVIEPLAREQNFRAPGPVDTSAPKDLGVSRF
jgi:hypothetical protein